MKNSVILRIAVGLPLAVLCSQLAAAPAQSSITMCKSSLTFTPHKDRGLMCYKKGAECICSPADFTKVGWPMTEVEPGKPGWNFHEISQRFLDELHNRRLEAKPGEGGLIGRQIRDVTELIERQGGE